MNPDETHDAPKPEDPQPAPQETEPEPTKSPDLDDEQETAPISADAEAPKGVDAAVGLPESEAEPLLTVENEPTAAKPVPAAVAEARSTGKAGGFFSEQPPKVIEVAPHVLRYRTRRDVLLFGVGAIAALAGVGFLLPQETLKRMGLHRSINSQGREWFLNRSLRIDDDVAEALYSRDRTVPTYTKSQITPLKNNYNGVTPYPGYIAGWNLTLDGLASGINVSLGIRNLLTRFPTHE